VLNTWQPFLQSRQESGAMASALTRLMYAHLLQQEVILGPGPFEVSESETQEFAVGVDQANAE